MQSDSGSIDGVCADRSQRAPPVTSDSRDSDAAAESSRRTADGKTADAVIIVDAAGIVQFINSLTSQLLGFSTSDLAGQDIRRFVTAARRAAFSEFLADARRGGNVVGVETAWLRKNDAPLLASVNLSPFLDADGRIAGACISSRAAVADSLASVEQGGRDERIAASDAPAGILCNDCGAHQSELEAVNARLVRATRDAKVAADAKAQFLANVSHEIRTPMTAILGYISVLSERTAQTDTASAEAIQVIRRNGTHLLALIEDILDITKLDAGTLEIRSRPFSPVAVANDVVQSMQVRARNKGIELDLIADADVPDRFESDSTRYRQILVNLVDNAIKFTEIGSVIVRIGHRQGPGGRMLDVCVADTGIGIDESRIAELFEPFTQADASMTRQCGGTGLGLGLCERLVKALGGAIRATGARGVGSEFGFTIPAATIAPASATSAEFAAVGASGANVPVVHPSSAETVGAGLAGSRVLLVEDGIDNRRLYQRFLSKAGAEIDIAENGAEAVAVVQKDSRDRFAPDIVIMDMQMPIMDGYEATRVLRKQGFTFPIIALTAHAMSGDRERCLEAGCDDYLSKPVDRSVLIARLGLWLTDPESARSAVSSSTATQ